MYYLLIAILFLQYNMGIAQSNFTNKSIPKNLAIPVTLNQNITSKNLRIGEVIEFEVPQDIEFNEGNIPMGTKVFAKVIKGSHKRKSWGKAGKIVLNISHMQINNQKIRLKAPYIEKEGVSKKGKARSWFWIGILWIPLNIIPPLCIKGEEAILEAGTTIIAYTIN